MAGIINLLQLNLFLLLTIMRQQKKRKKHRFWVREIFQGRQELGAYHRLIMGRVVSFPVVEIGFILSQRYCRFLFISVVAGLLILLQRQVTTDNDLMETRLKSQQVWYKNSLVATCYLQTCYNLLEQLVASMWKTSFDNQLATSLLNTCNRLVINKLLQDMGTHPDIGLL